MAFKALTLSVKPSWAYQVPHDSILGNFHNNPNIPTNFVAPSNKYIIYENNTNIEMPLGSTGYSDLVKYGFTLLGDTIGFPGQTVYPPRANKGTLVGDAAWCDINNGDNYLNWYFSNLVSRANNLTALIIDFEHQIISNWVSNHWAKWTDIMSAVRATGCKIGAWGREDARIDPPYEWTGGSVGSGVMTGVRTNTAADQWATAYLTDTSGYNASGLYNDTDRGSMAIPFCYLDGKGYADTLYQTIRTVEWSRKKHPTVLQCPTIWLEMETTGSSINNIQTKIELKMPVTGVIAKQFVKTITPPSFVYNTQLLALTLFDGGYLFGSGASSTDDLNNAFDFTYASGDIPKSKNVRGIAKPAGYWYTYQALSHLQVLANYQMSQTQYKTIIENSNPWLLAEYKRSGGAFVVNGIDLQNWQTGNKTTPDWCNRLTAPIIRYKLNAAGTEALVIAMNPSRGVEVETWNFRPLGGGVWDSTVKLVGGWAQVGIITL